MPHITFYFGFQFASPENMSLRPKKEAYIHARTQFTAPKLLYRDRLKERSLGCVKCAPAASGGQDAGIMQPRDHSLADPCT